jgi:leucyl-tRNA synthetase
VKRAQVNWIGKSEGAKIRFQISNVRSKIKELEVFTTRPDTLYGATFMVIAPEHELALELSKNNEEIKNYIKTARKKSEMERVELTKTKTGVFSGLYAINPVNNKEIPIWISDFVLVSYGTGAIMSVPAHDERDHAFAKKYKLSIVPVISKESWDFEEKAYSEVSNGIMVNSPKWEGLKPEEAFKKAIEWLTENKIGEKSDSYHLRDWIFSRQHYWGEPIPMIECVKCGWVPVPEKELPVVLPEIEAYEPSEDGKSPLSKIDSFVKCRCPTCGGEAKRETDTMPNWAGSDWYFLAYCFAKRLSKNEASDIDVDIFSSSNKELKKWCPVDVYVGGDEHNTLHLLYSRFIYQFLNEIGVVPEKIPEPYFRRISHGVILGPDNQRMSKSKGNIIVPETVADKYGVDVLRLYLMFMGPFESVMAWNEKTLMGVKRFLDRFSLFVNDQIKLGLDSNEKSRVIINNTILGVMRDYESFKFNTAVAKLMEAINGLDQVGKDDLRIMVQLLSPLAPYTSEELWERLGGTKSVHQSSWPKHNEKYLNSDKVKLPIAINGKVREVLELNKDNINNKEYLMAFVAANIKLQKLISGKKIIKEVLVPGRMLNLVVSE